MNRIVTALIDLLGDAFPIADPPRASGPALVRWPSAPIWRRIVGMGLFLLLAALPFVAMRWLG